MTINRRSNLPVSFISAPQANRRAPQRNLTVGDPQTSVCRCLGDVTERRTARMGRTRKTAHQVSLASIFQWKQPWINTWSSRRAEVNDNIRLGVQKWHSDFSLWCWFPCSLWARHPEARDFKAPQGVPFDEDWFLVWVIRYRDAFWWRFLSPHFRTLSL